MPTNITTYTVIQTRYTMYMYSCAVHMNDLHVIALLLEMFFLVSPTCMCIFMLGGQATATKKSLKMLNIPIQTLLGF